MCIVVPYLNNGVYKVKGYAVTILEGESSIKVCVIIVLDVMQYITDYGAIGGVGRVIPVGWDCQGGWWGCSNVITRMSGGRFRRVGHRMRRFR